MYIVLKTTEFYSNKKQKFVRYKGGFNISKIEKLKETFYIDNVAFQLDKKTNVSRMKTRKEIEEVNRASISRTLRSFRQILKANEWKFFLTLTFNNDFQNRENEKEVYKSFKHIMQMLKRKAKNLKYVAVSENHKKHNAIHFHLLLADCSFEELELIQPYVLIHKYACENKENLIDKYYLRTYKNVDNKNRRLYMNENIAKFGKHDFSVVDSQIAVACYLYKYLKKSFCNERVNKKRFFCSRNILKPILHKEILSFENKVSLKDIVDTENYTQEEFFKNIVFFDEEIDFLEIKFDYFVPCQLSFENFFPQSS